jgi:hypothetical protein
VALRGGRKGEGNDRASTISKYITSVQVGGVVMCTESVE